MTLYNLISITKLIILLKNILFEMYKHAKYMEKKKNNAI